MIPFDFSKVENGTIIRLKNDPIRDWVCLHMSRIDMDLRVHHNPNTKNHTGFYLFGGLWYPGDPLTSAPYGKCVERLERGLFNNITGIVGDMKDKDDAKMYREKGKIER